MRLLRCPILKIVSCTAELTGAVFQVIIERVSRVTATVIAALIVSTCVFTAVNTSSTLINIWGKRYNILLFV